MLFPKANLHMHYSIHSFKSNTKLAVFTKIKFLSIHIFMYF